MMLMMLQKCNYGEDDGSDNIYKITISSMNSFIFHEY